MSVIDTLVVELGPVIAHTILALWVRDPNMAPNFAANAISDLAQYFQGKVGTVLDQRNAARQFEAIGEKVAASFSPIIESEGMKLEESSWKAVTHAVAITLQRSSIDASILAQNNLDPMQLNRYLLSHRDGLTSWMSTEELSLYEKIILECSHNILGIAESLPRFNERSLAEIMRQGNRLLEVTQTTLYNTRIILESTRDLIGDASDLEIRYRNIIRKKMNKIHIFGMDASSTSTIYGLSMAYIKLMVNQHGKQSDRIVQFTDIESALSENKRLHLIGNAGAGKTTILQWIALKSSENGFPKKLSHWNNKIPFMIKLREFSQINLPTPQEILKHVSPTLADSKPNDWVSTLLRSGNAILLIDGIDEMSKSKRSKALDWIDEMTNAFPDAYYVVTSRPYATKHRRLVSSGFKSAELQPMTLEAIDEFIDKWHLAVKNELSDDSDEIEVMALGDNLKQTIRWNTPVKKLTTNPLLCAMICALHRERYRQLPNRRVALYDAACRMLLEDRDKARSVVLDDYPNLDYEQKRVLLFKLAYWMLKNDRLQVDRSDVEALFQREIKGIQGVTNQIDVASVYSLFIERSGLLQEIEVDKAEFIHRTFLEFLAAVAAIDERGIRFLVSQSDDEKWHEVIVLAAGLADYQGRSELVQWLIEKGDKNRRQGAMYYLLAASCLDNTVEINPDIASVVATRVATLIPPTNENEARLLSQAGNLAIPYLVSDPNRLDRIAKYCISTLMYIRSDEALEALSTYALDNRFSVMTQLTSIWAAFDKKTYAEKVLGNSTHLLFYGNVDFSGCKYLKNLHRVTITDNSHLTDLEPIADAGLTNIYELEITECPYIDDLYGIERLRSLKVLSLSVLDSLVDLVPIAKMKNITVLRVKFCEKIHDFSPIAGLISLEELEIVGGTFSDIEIFSSLYNLKKLIVDDYFVDQVQYLKDSNSKLEIVWRSTIDL